MRTIASITAPDGEWTYGEVDMDRTTYLLENVHLTRRCDDVDDADGTRHCVVWSGGLGDAPFEPSPQTWLSQGWGALHVALLKQPDVLIRPHWTHVASDGPSLMRLDNGLDDLQVPIVLAPASMLSPEMLKDTPDHLDRFMDHVGDRCSLLLLEDLDLQGRPVDLGLGVLPGSHIGRLIDRHVPEHIGVIGRASSATAVLDWLS